jgi:hypothetical protein
VKVCWSARRAERGPRYGPNLSDGTGVGITSIGNAPESFPTRNRRGLDRVLGNAGCGRD